MLLEIKIPSPGESITEAVLARWLVNDGDYVEKDQEIAEIESDKATLPLIASNSGVVKFLFGIGETVKIGAIACTIDTSASRPEKISNDDKKELPKEVKKSAEPIVPSQESTNEINTVLSSSAVEVSSVKI